MQYFDKVTEFNNVIKLFVFLILCSAVSQLISSKIKVFVYIIYVCEYYVYLLCIYI